jgi:hypothetical protein
VSFILSSFSSLSSSSQQTYKKKSSAESFKSIESIRTESEEHEKELANLVKFYTNEAKYSDENDSFSFKLTIFHDMCDRVDVLQLIKLKTFSIMLKDLTFDYYYSNMFANIVTVITFDEICFSMKNYFEDVEYKRDILFKWNNMILKSMMTSNEDKSVEECFQLLIKQLRHLQHDLNSKLRSEKFIHNKLINACQDVFVCQYCYAFALSTSTSHLVISSTLSIRQACLTVLVTLQSIESFDSLIMLRFSASELKNEQKISNESFTERFTKKFISWYSHHDLKTTWRWQINESKSTSKLFIS